MPKPLTLHHTNSWPWVVNQYVWLRAAEYKTDPPIFWAEWFWPLVPLDSYGRVGAVSRCGRKLDIDRFAPSNDTVGCVSCLNLLSVGCALDSEIRHAAIDELPESLQYLRVCGTSHCPVIVAPPEELCVLCKHGLGNNQ